MTNPTVTMRRDSATVATVTFANPPVNLIVGDTVTALAAIVDELYTDPAIQVVVFRSNVPDFFLNHFDLAKLDDFPATDAGGRNPWTDLVIKLSTAPFVSVGVIRGRTRGGGNEFALALDLRYASLENAFFGQPEVGTAVVPGGGGTERLPRAVGRDRALEVILSSKDYPADVAERWGWVTRALPDDELDAFVDELVSRLAAFDRTALSAAKSMINRATLPPVADLESAYREFEHLATLPGYLVRAAATPSLRPEQALELERNLGEFLGAAAKQRAAAQG